MTESARRRRDKALEGELVRIRAAFPHVAGDPRLARVARRLATLCVGFRELRLQVKHEGGAGKADIRRVVELRQYASEIAGHEAQLQRAALDTNRQQDSMQSMVAIRNRYVAAAKAREQALKALPAPVEPPLSAMALLREQREIDG